MTHWRDRGVRWLWISALVVCLDQWTKWLANSMLELYAPVEWLPVLNMTLMHNTGMAFSLLADQPGWQRWFISVVALVIVIWLVLWLLRNPREWRWQNISLCLIVGGALGNLWDRVTLGHVVDFIQVHYNEAYFPAFNVADSAITCGAILLILETFFVKHEDTAG